MGEYCAGLFHIIREVRAEGDVYVLVVQVDPSAFPHSVVRLGSVASPDVHRVGHVVAVVALKGVDQAVARSQQKDEHEYSPGHGEAGEGGAELVPPDVAPDFFKQIFHRLLHYCALAERRGVVTNVLLDLADDTVLDVDDAVGEVGYSALVGHHDDGHIFLLVQFPQKVHNLHGSL